MTTIVEEKIIDWQVPSANDCGITEEDYRAMVKDAENSGYMSYKTHRKKLNEWLNENM
jgi:hypothetical protein